MVVARLNLRYLTSVRPPTLLVALAACTSGSARPVGPQEITYRGELAGEEESPPSYGRSELQQALIAERAAEARAEREVADAQDAAADSDRLRIALGDLAVRRRFIQILELCEAQGRMCPPRLDDPPWSYAVDAEVDPALDVPLRFDLDSWRNVSAELHGRACACRTVACIDSMDATIARLELRPMADVQSDETATQSVTRARECLMRLRGKKRVPLIASPTNVGRAALP